MKLSAGTLTIAALLVSCSLVNADEKEHSINMKVSEMATFSKTRFAEVKFLKPSDKICLETATKEIASKLSEKAKGSQKEISLGLYSNGSNPVCGFRYGPTDWTPIPVKDICSSTSKKNAWTTEMAKIAESAAEFSNDVKVPKPQATNPNATVPTESPEAKN